MMLRSILIIIAAISLSPAGFGATEAGSVVSEAVSVYQQALDESDRDRRVQLFRQSETLFDEAVTTLAMDQADKPINPDLYVNLGNAALGAEHLGLAILSYRRAMSLDPNHHRAGQNLRHARTLLPDWVPVPEQESVSFGSFFDWLGVLSRSDWFGIASILFLLCALFAAAYLRIGGAVLRGLFVVSLVAWIGALVWPLLVMTDQGQPIAVVVVPEVTARSADSINAPTRLREPLPSGTELQVIDDREIWVQVRLFDSREAWLPKSAVKQVEQ